MECGCSYVLNLLGVKGEEEVFASEWVPIFITSVDISISNETI